MKIEDGIFDCGHLLRAYKISEYFTLMADKRLVLISWKQQEGLNRDGKVYTNMIHTR